jgi:hypothetical protein
MMTLRLCPVAGGWARPLASLARRKSRARSSTPSRPWSMYSRRNLRGPSGRLGRTDV